uniref:RNase H type-1 domain-containing protein n=1 Tax=Triticum urartu TaxID=4572 RepID=A0A8R7TS40_TRIUA
GHGAWGCVARSDHGEVIFACAGKLEFLASPLQAEATACIKAIEAASELGIHRVIFESDSLQLVNALKTGEYDKSSIGVLLREVRSICCASFDAF